jgi:hypothetical protein
MAKEAATRARRATPKPTEGLSALLEPRAAMCCQRLESNGQILDGQDHFQFEMNGSNSFVYIYLKI